jgi:hypothetical protein
MSEAPSQIPETQEPGLPLTRLLDEQELIMHLEPDQIVAETARPLPRAHLSRRVVTGLWALRVFVLIASAMVIYTFVAQLS